MTTLYSRAPKLWSPRRRHTKSPPTSSASFRAESTTGSTSSYKASTSYQTSTGTEATSSASLRRTPKLEAPVNRRRWQTFEQGPRQDQSPLTRFLRVTRFPPEQRPRLRQASEGLPSSRYRSTDVLGKLQSRVHDRTDLLLQGFHETVHGGSLAGFGKPLPVFGKPPSVVGKLLRTSRYFFSCHQFKL